MGSRRAPRARYEVSALIRFCLPGNSPSAHAGEGAGVRAARVEESLALLVLPRGTEWNRCSRNYRVFFVFCFLMH